MVVVWFEPVSAGWTAAIVKLILLEPDVFEYASVLGHQFDVLWAVQLDVAELHHVVVSVDVIKQVVDGDGDAYDEGDDTDCWGGVEIRELKQNG